MLPRRRRARLGLRSIAGFVFAIVAALVGGCGDADADAAIDQAAEDLGCDRSRIEVLDTEHSSDPNAPDRFRLFACGQEVVYECSTHATRQHPRRGCARDSYRFPT